MYRPYLLLLFGLVTLGIAVGVVCYQSSGKLTPEQIAEKHGLILVRIDSECYLCKQPYDIVTLRELILQKPDELRGVVRVVPINNEFGGTIVPPVKWGTTVSTSRLMLDGDPEIIQRILPDLE